jgi:hypothetical protein
MVSESRRVMGCLLRDVEFVVYGLDITRTVF